MCIYSIFCSEELENRFNASKMAIITIMRSWPGESEWGFVIWEGGELRKCCLLQNSANLI